MPQVSQDVITAYPVEVSGWDAQEEFFVEKTDLQWSEQTGKQVLLAHRVAPGALLFLRLLHPTSQDRVYPVPYQAEVIGPTEAGECRVRLYPARPRRSEG